MNNCFIILAAGKSNRFNSKIPKPFIQYNGDILIKHSINKAILSKKFSKIVVAINKNHKKYLKKLKLNKVQFVNGGKTRADSAKNCLNHIKKYKPKYVFIHDAARPNFSLSLIFKLLKALKSNDGAIPVIQSIDSLKLRKNKKIHNLDRKKIFFSQTPQAFKYKVLMELQNKINKETTDDSSLLITANKKIKLIKGEDENSKITSLKDIIENKVYYGIGFDVHRLIPGKKMYLGGIKIKSKLGTLGHSDGDPILHAITDAILGACRMGDIGEKFSDKSKKYKNIRSTILLNKVMRDIKSKNFDINNIDINVITETPKLKKFKKKIILSISRLCKINKDKINLKGKTAEKLGVIGKEKAIACEVIASIQKNMIKIFGKLILTMFNIGKLGKFPGTIASAITSVFYIIFFYFKVHYFKLFFIFLLLLLISVYLINFLKDEFEEVDSKEIVIDEYLGQSIPILFFYVILFEASVSINFFMIIALISFIGFRFFDILKPYPINYIDNNYKNGFGVIFDDIVAGIFTTIVLYLFIIVYDKF